MSELYDSETGHTYTVYDAQNNEWWRLDPQTRQWVSHSEELGRKVCSDILERVRRAAGQGFTHQVEQGSSASQSSTAIKDDENSSRDEERTRHDHEDFLRQAGGRLPEGSSADSSSSRDRLQSPYAASFAQLAARYNAGINRLKRRVVTHLRVKLDSHGRFHCLITGAGENQRTSPNVQLKKSCRITMLKPFNPVLSRIITKNRERFSISSKVAPHGVQFSLPGYGNLNTWRDVRCAAFPTATTWTEEKKGVSLVLTIKGLPLVPVPHEARRIFGILALNQAQQPKDLSSATWSLIWSVLKPQMAHDPIREQNLVATDCVSKTLTACQEKAEIIANYYKLHDVHHSVPVIFGYDAVFEAQIGIGGSSFKQRQHHITNSHSTCEHERLERNIVRLLAYKSWRFSHGLTYEQPTQMIGLTTILEGIDEQIKNLVHSLEQSLNSQAAMQMEIELTDHYDGTSSDEEWIDYDYSSCRSNCSMCSDGQDDSKQDIIHLLIQPLAQWLQSNLEEHPRVLLRSLENGKVSTTAPSEIFYKTANGSSSSGCDSSSLNTSNQDVSTSAGAVTPHATLNSSTLKRDLGRRKSDDDEDGNEERKRRRPNSKPANMLQQSGKEFACPFFKRRPKKYGDRKACRSSSWKNVHRLKCDHLYKDHLLPIRCDRCGDKFSSRAERTRHSRQDEPCKKTDVIWEEGISEAQEEQLKCRKRDKDWAAIDDADTLELEKWGKVYKILFPDDDPSIMPSPYFELERMVALSEPDARSIADASLSDFVRYELLAELRRKLSDAYDQKTSEIHQDLQNQVLDMVRALIERRLAEEQSEQCRLKSPPNHILTSSNFLTVLPDKSTKGKEGVEGNASVTISRKGDGPLSNRPEARRYRNNELERMRPIGRAGAASTFQPTGIVDEQYSIISQSTSGTFSENSLPSRCEVLNSIPRNTQLPPFINDLELLLGGQSSGQVQSTVANQTDYPLLPDTLSIDPLYWPSNLDEAWHGYM